MFHATGYRTLSCAVALLALGNGAMQTAEAGEATYLPLNASYCEIFRVLSNEVPGECSQVAEAPAGMKTRSIRVDPPARPATAIVESAAVPLPSGEADAFPEQVDLSFAMPIQFEYDSDILTDDAMVSLDTIASVLASDIMEEKVILLEGHADATGSDSYNLGLSIRRARAVQVYLIQMHDIEDWRLPFVGKGESELYDWTLPTSSTNRRVEFSNVTG